MSNRKTSRKDDVREFLISLRANITPAQAGLPNYGGERRVPGLRREEVAMLAGVSLDYYTQLERGNLRGASDSVLTAIARALQLNDIECNRHPADAKIHTRGELHHSAGRDADITRLAKAVAQGTGSY